MRSVGGGAFQDELRRETAKYFAETGRPARDVPAMYLKTAIILVWFVASWAFLVFWASSAWTAIPLAMSLGFAMAGIGMAIQHDANHGAYSDRRFVNRALGALLDMAGASSYVWRLKHNVVHHTYTNIQGADDDLDVGPLARLSPTQPRHRAHRFQHLYMWALYGFLHPKWVLIDDFVCLAQRRVAQQRLAPMGKVDAAIFVVGKLFFVTWSVVIPALFHPLWLVVLVHLAAAFVVGVVLAVTFQLAHCLEEADFPAETRDSFAAHQVATTVDFACKNPFLTWYMGGLNFQVEHHLFPRVAHVHYPALARIVEEVATRHGLRYRVHRTLRGAVRSHYRHLRELGRPIANASTAADSLAA